MELNITSVSVSRIQLYLTCAKLFYEKYINKSGILEEKVQAALIQGSLAHLLLETRLQNKDLELLLPELIAEWLVDTCGLPVVNNKEQMLDLNGIHIDSLLDYAKSVVPLLLRCSASYEGDDAIRTSAGKPLADPFEYPSASFTREYAKLNLYHLKQELDICAARQHEDFTNNNISISSIVANSITYATQFTYPEDFQETLHVELDLHRQDSPIEIVPGVKWLGFIDWVYKTKSGEIVIVDHKTNKLIPNSLEVEHHEQLNIYAALYYETYGIWPSKIGIQHLKSNTLVTAATNIETSAQIYKYYKEIVQEIIRPRSIWLRQPAAKVYSGTCVKKFGLVKHICPLISSCWPNFNPEAI
jgi:PD-(D/E)XK nuclease superfamily